MFIAYNREQTCNCLLTSELRQCSDTRPEHHCCNDRMHNAARVFAQPSSASRSGSLSADLGGATLSDLRCSVDLFHGLASASLIPAVLDCSPPTSGTQQAADEALAAVMRSTTHAQLATWTALRDARDGAGGAGGRAAEAGPGESAGG